MIYECIWVLYECVCVHNFMLVVSASWHTFKLITLRIRKKNQQNRRWKFKNVPGQWSSNLINYIHIYTYTYVLFIENSAVCAADDDFEPIRTVSISIPISLSLIRQNEFVYVEIILYMHICFFFVQTSLLLSGLSIVRSPSYVLEILQIKKMF